MPSLLAPLVGRDAEVGALTQALDAAEQGVAGVVTFVGDAGVGKSRLAEEALALARARGFLTLRAAASPLHGDLHYGVVVDALRPLVRGVEAGARARLVAGLSDLGRLFGGLNLPAPAPLGDPRMERTRLFEALYRLFDRLTRQQPTLLVVDDLHWADQASIAALHYVVRGLVDRRFLLLVTVRAGESSDDVETLLATLDRSGSLTRVDVGCLDRSAVTALARGLLADEPPATLTGLLAERTRGLPLFVRALVLMLVESGRLFRSAGRWVLGPQTVDDIPPEVSGLLRSQLNALDLAERAIVDTVAVAGGAIEHGLLSALAPNESDLLLGVQRLRAAGLIEEDLGQAGVQYRVTHPLLAEVAYDELPAVVRRRRHAAIATALGRVDAVNLGRLAHHVRGAGDEVDPGTALDVLLAALDAALSGKAGQEAVAHAEAAIELAHRLDRAELVARLREQRAEALELAGHGDAAITAWREAAEESLSRDHAVDAAGQLRRLALVEWDTGHPTDSQAHLDQAMAVLPAEPVATVHLAIAETQMRMLARRGLVPELRAKVEEIDHIASATGSRYALALAHLGRSDLCLRIGDHGAAERAIGVVMRVAREDELALLLEEAHRPAYCNELAWGDHVAARQLAEEASRLAREFGAPALEIPDRACVALTDFLAGAWDDAMRGADELLALSHRVGMRRGVAAALCARALVHARRGQLSEAVTCLGEARSVYGEGFTSDQHLLGLGEVCEAMVLLGRCDAHAALRAATAIRAGGVAVPAFCMSVLGEAQVAAGDLTGAVETATIIAGHGPGAPYPAAVSAWIEGLVARAADDPRTAAVAFDRAAEGFTGIAMPYEAATARLDWAQVVGAEGSGEERDGVVPIVIEALDVLERLVARPAADRARRLLRELGARPTSSPRARASGELSAREVEIARLVAEGLSNPEIASRLFISQRTVTTHLHHIYQRLGVGSRTGLTRYVVEQLSWPRRIT